MRKGTISILSTIIGAAVGVSAGAFGVQKTMGEKLQKKSDMSDKHLALFLMMNQWVKVKQEGKNLSSYFENNGYKKIAIYGMSYAGETLINELKDSNIEIAYGIDKKADGIYEEFDVLTPDDELDPVEAVVVTPIFFIDEIEEMLSEKISCPIISLEDILYEV